MKKYLLLAASILILSAPVAWSQTAPGGGSGQQQPPGGGGQMQPGGPQGHGDGQNFQEHKAEILQHMNRHLQEVQSRIRCVEAANDHEALRACLPEMGGHHGGPGGRGGPGGEQGGGQGGGMQHGGPEGGEPNGNQ